MEEEKVWFTLGGTEGDFTKVTNSSCIPREEFTKKRWGRTAGRGRAQGKVQVSEAEESQVWMELGNSGERGSRKGLSRTLERVTITPRRLDCTQQSVESPVTGNVPNRSKAEISHYVGLVLTKPHPSQPVPEAR